MSIPRLTRSGRLAAFFLLCTLVGTSCDATVDEEDRCAIFDTCDAEQALKLTLIEHHTRKPANVSILFKVDTDEGHPVASLTPSSFAIYENEALVSRFESQQQILPKSGTFKYSIALLLDLSGSIVASENLGALKQAAQSFVEAVMFPKNDPRYGEIEMGIWWFDGRKDIDSLVGFRIDPAMLVGGIERIDEDITVDNSTNLYGAVIQGIEQVRLRLQAADRQNVIAAGSVAIFTDGTDQANRETRSAALRAVENAPSSISVYTIGLGGEIDVPTLEAIGTSGFVSAVNLTELVPRFQELASLVRDEANSYYLLEYCSPKRAGENDLTIKATSGDYVGLLSTRFSARDFSAGCSVSDPFFGKALSTSEPLRETRAPGTAD